MNTAVPAAPPPRTRRILIWGALGAVALAVAAGAWAWWADRATPSGLLQINGRIEGDQIAVAPKAAGRIAELLVREGDEVKAGQLLARLTDEAVDARQAQALAGAAAQRAQALALETSAALLQSETAVQLASAQAGLAAARADLGRTQAAALQEERDLERMRDLAARGFVGPQAVERSELTLRSSREQQAAAQAAVARAEQALRDAELGPQRVRARLAEASSMRAQATAAEARVREAATQIADLTVSAPLTARVSNRYANAGEVIAAGTPIFGLTDLANVYLKGYVPEPMIGRIRLGQAAQIWTDAWPEAPFEARVGYIAARAQFTPKEVQTRDERTKLVYEVRLYPLADPGGKLLPGQPADGMIRHDETAAWQRPRH
ncbi:MAG: efflux RND transporter periplasmic adaptor subunit [Burkholderiales bacterium]|jgi:HlyD family secretion protein|nr:efflux RND transporter periplasmic adaptor subunit [Burkholderiales bacterium]MCA3216933.1 efflux RND transporter periplasmic adaptor subunit [Burkholderiales bacterium]MCA3224809.1 efflux RND transporter periplasmic adaptor subunit [Burkholderiales bacterium]MCE2645919.1 efflux RND transporter periplasmic adaptor subunit [Burkholderiaceae bacterium]